MALIKLLFISLASSSFVEVSAQCIAGNCTNGWGTYLWSDGNEYTGEWVNGDRTGLGCYDWADGSFYYGYFRQGKLHGDGIYLGTESSKDLFGIFQEGSLVESKSFASIGCIIGDCVNGAGVYLWESNDIFIGQWTGGTRTGFGRYDWADGSLYTGFFLEGKLNGKGSYVNAVNKTMEGLFINNEFQDVTFEDDEETGSSTVATTHSTTITETDLCSVLQAAISDYPNNFENLKVKIQPKDEPGLSNTWEANQKVSGSVSSVISEGWTGSHNTWYGVLYEGSSEQEAINAYEDMVKHISECTKGTCCTFTTGKSDYDGDSQKSYRTYWMTVLVRDGQSDAYEDMLVECELNNNNIDKDWTIVVRVKQMKK